jgi:xanthine/CO dehydrogenase XdhC/CoxF family maturation factor/YHS domain-containing protein
MSLAKTLGYRTVVVDPRSAFGNEERFPNVDKLIQKWPQEAFQEIPLTRSTAVAMLTHDPKLDDPALQLALPSPAFYVGALGSKTTQAKRRKRLLDEGVSEEQLNRLHGPIGLEIGAVTPEEIALSILAEIIQRRRQFSNSLVSSISSLELPITQHPVLEALDPVCGMTVEIATAHFTSEYNGKTYYFCAAGCKRSFDKEPGKYIQAEFSG